MDAFTFAHAERAERGPYPTMQAFAVSSMDERWLDQDPAQMVEGFFAYSRERFSMILDDLSALPVSPGIVAEGPQLLPELVAPRLDSPQAAVWLFPSGPLQSRLLSARPSAVPEHTADPERAREKLTERNALIARATREAADERGLAVVEVDSFEQAGPAIEARLGPLAHVAGTSDAETVRGLRRDENLMVLDQLQRYWASPEAPRSGSPRYAFACECSEVGCGETVELDAAEYEQLVAQERFVSAHPGVPRWPSRPLG